MIIPPPIHRITDIALPNYEKFVTNKGIPVYQIKQKGCNIIRLDISFKAGRHFEDIKMSASLCAAMMNESNTTYQSTALAGKIEYYGATLHAYSTLDTIEIELVCLRKYFEEVAELLITMLREPLFLEEELGNLVERRMEKLKVQLAKNEVVAFRTITETIFGINHPYGYNSSEKYYKAVTGQDLLKHYRNNLVSSRCAMFLAGDFSSSDKTIINRISEYIQFNASEVIVPNPIIEPCENKDLYISGSETQTSIRMARMGIKRSHPEFDGLNFLSLILGGFFGSRLVSNIREDKGLTYNILSQLDFYHHAGTLMINTDVTKENVGVCIDEIFKEMDTLQNEPIGRGELELARNYLLGSYLNLFDGAFNSIRAIKSLVLAEIPLGELNASIDVSKSIDSECLLQLSRKYLNRNDFWKVVVGSV